MNHKIAQLLLTPNNKSKVFSDIYLAQPDTIKESLVGKLFVLIEIESDKSETLKIINFLIDNLNHSYYQNEKVILREKISSLKIEHIFEAALAKTNKNFSEFIKNEKIRTSAGAINITAGVIYENEIHFANTGKNKAFLIYPNKNTKGKNEPEYKIFNINQKQKPSERSENKLFSNVISGKIPPKSSFIFANEALPEYISQSQLVDIITTLPPVSSVEHIKNILININAYVSFLGIIIKSSTAENLGEQKKSIPISAQDSITSLNRTEESTENILTPSGMMAGSGKWLRLPGLSKEKNSQFAGAAVLKDKIFMKKNPLLKLGMVGAVIKNITVYSVGLVIHVIKTISNKEKVVNLPSALGQNAKNKIQRTGQFFVNLSYRNKIFLALFALFIILFAINTLFMKNNNEKAENQEKYNSLKSEIEQKENQLEANLLYNNTESAGELIDEIKKLLEDIPKETEEQNQEYSALNEKLDLQLEKIRNVTRVDDAQELANFSNLNSSANSASIIFSEEANKIYAGDTGQNSVYILDISNNAATTLSDLKETGGLGLAAKGNSSNIFYLSGEKIVELKTDSDAVSSLPISLTNETKNIANLDSYNSQIYTLNKESNQIYKFARSGQSFGAGTPWIKNNVDLINAQDLSIDGQIYILLKNGEVLKFLKGEKQDFAMEKVEPTIEEATKIYVSPELKFIYVLEPKNKRLIIFDKTGKFILQYKADKFDNLKDFAVDEKNKVIYFLNGNTVFKAEGKHF